MPAEPRDPSMDALLGLAIAEPDRAEAWARRLLDAETDPWVLSVARQAHGVVLRDRGRLHEALPELRESVRLAHRSRDVDREADARATLGLTLAIAGRTHAGLAQLQRALDAACEPRTIARILMRRGHLLYFVVVRPEEALADLELALPTFRRVGDPIWTARTLNLIGLSLTALGRTGPAASAVQEAEEIFTREGQVAESVVTLHNRGWIARCQGDLPAALRLYDEAADAYAALGEDYPLLVVDRCDALLAAGLAPEAVDLADRRIRQGSLEAVHEAELLLTLATAELADDRPAAAAEDATRARLLFRRQGRDWWAVRAELALLLARHRAGGAGRRLADSAADVARRLDDSRSEEAATAWLLAGRVAAAAGLDSAPGLLGHAAGFRHRASGLVSASGWHAQAIERELEGRPRGVLAACRRGLDALDEHRATLGSSELRALAARHGDELASLALRHATERGARVLLEWSERRRATALFQPPVRPPDDHDLAEALAARRDARRRLAAARAEGSTTVSPLEEDCARLELAIRRRARHLAGSASAVPRFETERLMAALGETTFVELVEVDGALHALVAARGRVRRFLVGEAAEAEQAVSAAGFALRQAARARPARLDEVGARLQAALLGDALRALGDGPVVVSPTSRLHTTPWSLLPALSDAAVSVVPSASLWLRARSTAARPGGSRVLVAGPGLRTGGGELDALRRRHPGSVVLRNGTATVERTLSALDGAAVAHIAAHGIFRGDSPMFSSLELDDGSLTVHDFERLTRAPHRVVLSACESGVMAPIGAGEMLGLVAAMVSMGSAGVVSSVAIVNDEATVEVMLDVHQGLDDGEDLGGVMLRARRSARGHSIHEATAAAFVAMGA